MDAVEDDTVEDGTAGDDRPVEEEECESGVGAGGVPSLPAGAVDERTLLGGGGVGASVPVDEDASGVQHPSGGQSGTSLRRGIGRW